MTLWHSNMDFDEKHIENGWLPSTRGWITGGGYDTRPHAIDESLCMLLQYSSHLFSLFSVLIRLYKIVVFQYNMVTTRNYPMLSPCCHGQFIDPLGHYNRHGTRNWRSGRFRVSFRAAPAWNDPPSKLWRLDGFLPVVQTKEMIHWYHNIIVSWNLTFSKIYHSTSFSLKNRGRQHDMSWLHLPAVTSGWSAGQPSPAVSINICHECIPSIYHQKACVCMCIYIYILLSITHINIYIYIDREIDRERDR